MIARRGADSFVDLKKKKKEKEKEKKQSGTVWRGRMALGNREGFERISFKGALGDGVVCIMRSLCMLFHPFFSFFLFVNNLTYIY